MKDITPREIVAELDKYIIGQEEAKRKVAIALRNRWRRQQLPEDIRDEVAPKNIIMIGPTGVGKTEIARRLSRLADAPFIKVEASKFTEVGYVGRDCESMVRELVETAVHMVKAEKEKELEPRARELAERRLLDLLLPPQPPRHQRAFRPYDANAGDEAPVETEETDAEQHTREILLKKLREGKLEDREVEVETRETVATPMMQVFSSSGLEEMGFNLQEMFGKIIPPRTRRRKVRIAEARKILEEEELRALIDMDEVVREALARTESSGIIFLDEIDKIASRGSTGGAGPDVSREGVQRDILPIVEGSNVVTKYGTVKTDHILFIAAGAFHMTKVSDLIPELQGRFPIRVELHSLKEEDFVRILREPENSLIKQYQALLATEGVEISFTQDAIDEIARICQQVNEQSENIGARRLHTIMECLLEEYLYQAPDCPENVRIDAQHVREKLSGVLEKQDIGRYIL